MLSSNIKSCFIVIDFINLYGENDYNVTDVVNKTIAGCC